MSTRAIIAIPTAKGYRTAWQWCDGFPYDLGKKLRNKFNTPELAKELVSHISFSSVMTKAEKEDYESDFTYGDFKELSNGLFLHVDSHDGRPVAGSGRYAFFKNIKDMLGQDLDYVYVFENGKWVTYK